MRRFDILGSLLLALGVALLVSAPAVAKSIDWSELAKHPDRYVGQTVEVAGAYCASGGVNGDAEGYQCSTAGALYIEASDVGPSSAKQKVDEDCGGMDVIERSSFCRATISFVPQSFTTSTELEPGKTVTVIETDAAELKF
jgi:hypothetical protein